MTISETGLQGLGRSRIKKHDYASAVATEVRVRAARLDVTQGELSNALNLSQTAISRRMSGKVAWDVVELAAVAVLLGCDIGDLLPRDYAGNPVKEVLARRSTSVTEIDRLRVAKSPDDDPNGPDGGERARRDSNSQPSEQGTSRPVVCTVIPIGRRMVGSPLRRSA